MLAADDWKSGEGVEEIAKEAFCQCTSLREISIPPTVKIIQAEAFHLCSQLTFVNLGEGVEEIGEMAFYGCTSLHEITISPAVKAIKANTFTRHTADGSES